MTAQKNYKPRITREHESNLGAIRVEEGFTIRELSEQTGICIGTISNLQNGMCPPIAYSKRDGSCRGDIKHAVHKLCKILKTTPGELFPRYVCDMNRVTHLESTQIIDITCGTYTKTNHWADKKMLLSIIKKLFDSLPGQRSALVLKKRFFDDQTLEEVSQDLKITKERVRQIEAKALRLLRHPARSRILRDYLYEREVQNG